MADRRVVLQVTLDESAAAKLRSLTKNEGRIQKAIASRVMEWFCQQPSFVRTVVTSDVDEGLEEAYASMLEKMAEAVRGKKPIRGRSIGLSGGGAAPSAPAKSAPARP